MFDSHSHTAYLVLSSCNHQHVNFSAISGHTQNTDTCNMQVYGCYICRLLFMQPLVRFAIREECMFDVHSNRAYLELSQCNHQHLDFGITFMARLEYSRLLTLFYIIGRLLLMPPLVRFLICYEFTSCVLNVHSHSGYLVLSYCKHQRLVFSTTFRAYF